MTRETEPAIVAARGDGGQPLRWSQGTWLGLSLAAAGLATAGNIIGLLRINEIYGEAYPALTVQAIAQDGVNLALVAPLIVISAIAVHRGSVAAYPIWLGALTFTVYNYVIYTFSIQFGPLFLLWLAVLGLATYALIGGLRVNESWSLTSRASGVGPRRTAGWFLIVIGVTFALLWLTDIVRAMRAGAVPPAAADLGLPTNPVHVLDLAFFLPAAITVGVFLLRRTQAGTALGAALLLFVALTGVPIMATPVIAWARGDAATWGLLVPIGAITVASAALSIGMARSLRPATPTAGAVAPGARREL
jgi:hypothetical protein